MNERGILLAPEETWLMFYFLESAEDLGLMRGSSVESRWDECRTRAWADPSAGVRLWELQSELDGAGRLQGTWIETRWHSLRARIRSKEADAADATRIPVAAK